MLGFIGRWAQSKGMKILPDWLGYNKDTVQANVIAEGFTVGQFVQSNSDLQSEETNHNKVISQSPTASTLQDYETPVDLTWRNFAFTPFSVFGFSPFGVFSFTPPPPPPPYFKWNPPLFLSTFSFAPAPPPPGPPPYFKGQG